MDEYVTVDGTDVPAVGLGTWRLTGDDCRRAVQTAIDLGYRHVDTAQAYDNERAVGDAIGAAAVDRSELFVTTKLDGDSRAYDDVVRSTEASLAKLDTDYVDLLLIHFPQRSDSLAETLSAMNYLVERGAVRHVGVSNFGVDRLHRARELSETPILADQVQFNPYWPQPELLDYCVVHDLTLTAYSPLAHGGVLDDPVLERVGRGHGKSPAQVAIRWCLDHPNVTVVPKATSRNHIAENADVFDFELTEAEREAVGRPSRLRALRGFVRGRLPV